MGDDAYKIAWLVASTRFFNQLHYSLFLEFEVATRKVGLHPLSGNVSGGFAGLERVQDRGVQDRAHHIVGLRNVNRAVAYGGQSISRPENRISHATRLRLNHDLNFGVNLG